MFAALMVCGLMTTSCSKEETVIPIDNQGQDQGQKEDETPSIDAVSLQVKYEAQASQAVIENYNLVGTAVLVRYIDSDGKIKSEPFTGKFTKDVTIPFTKHGVEAAFQVLLVLKNKEEIEFGEGVNVATEMNFTWAVNYSDKSQSEAIVFSTDNGFGNARPNLIESYYDNYVSHFGGFVPTMVHLGYYAEEVENHIKIEGPRLLAASFWREHAYTGQ